MQKQYDSYRHTARINEDCVFCKPQKLNKPIERENFVILQNRFKYEIWDGCRVLDHLMVIPKRHVDRINHLTDIEKAEYVTIIGEYEAHGYSLYSRAVQSTTRSVIHLHTHLIKLDPKPIRGLFYLEKPHVLLYRK